MFLIAVYIPTKICETKVVVFYTKLDSILDKSSPKDILIILVNFSAMNLSPWFWYQEQ